MTFKLSENKFFKDVFLIIPWRETPSRKLIFKKVLDNYKQIFDDKNIIFCDSGSKIFNLSASRNIGIEQAINKNVKAIVVSDADVLVNLTTLIKAIKYAINNNKIVLPYNKVIQQDYDCNVLFTLPVPQPNRINPCSLCIIIPTEIYKVIGGFDENFVGWGPEDIDFHLRYINKYKEMFKTFEDNINVFETNRSEWKINEQVLKNYEYFWSKYPELKDIYKPC